MFMSLSERVQGSLIRNNAFSNPTPDLSQNLLQKTFRRLLKGILKGGKMDKMVMGGPKTLKLPKLTQMKPIEN